MHRLALPAPLRFRGLFRGIVRWKGERQLDADAAGKDQKAGTPSSRRHPDLETDLHTKSGAVRYIDFMPPRGTNPDIVRIIEGLEGQVTIRMPPPDPRNHRAVIESDHQLHRPEMSEFATPLPPSSAS